MSPELMAQVATVSLEAHDKGFVSEACHLAKSTRTDSIQCWHVNDRPGVPKDHQNGWSLAAVQLAEQQLTLQIA